MPAQHLTASKRVRAFSIASALADAHSQMTESGPCRDVPRGAKAQSTRGRIDRVGYQSLALVAAQRERLHPLGDGAAKHTRDPPVG